MKDVATTTQVAVFAVMVALAAFEICAPTASAAPTGEAGSGTLASPWSEATEVVTAGNSPSLSSDPARPGSDATGELAIGLGLVGLALSLRARLWRGWDEKMAPRHAPGYSWLAGWLARNIRALES